MTGKRIGRWLIVFSLTVGLIVLPTIPVTYALSDYFPGNEDQVKADFGLGVFPGGTPPEIIPEAGGWEVHCNGCDLQSIGSKLISVCVDYDPSNSHFEGDPALVHEYARKGGQWRRMQLDPGGVAAWRGMRISIYPGVCQPIPGQQSPAIQPAAPAPGTLMVNAPGGSLTCPLGVQLFTDTFGGSEQQWQQQPTPNGRVYSGENRTFTVPDGWDVDFGPKKYHAGERVENAGLFTAYYLKGCDP